MEAAHIVFQLGFLQITSTVVTTWGILLLLGVGAWLATRNLSVASPGLVQTALEGAVQSIEAAIEGVLPGRSGLLLPFVGTLWIFVAVANLTGLVPELHSPTGDLSTTAALAFLPADKAAAIGALVTLGAGLWKTWRSHRKVKKARGMQRRRGDKALGG